MSRCWPVVFLTPLNLQEASSVRFRYCTNSLLAFQIIWNLRFSADQCESPALSGASKEREDQTGHQHMLVSFPRDLDERRDCGKFTQLYKTGQNGKGDHRSVWRHFLKRVTLIQRSIMNTSISYTAVFIAHFIFCNVYMVICQLQKVFS